jgi:hypothetical protein
MLQNVKGDIRSTLRLTTLTQIDGPTKESDEKEQEYGRGDGATERKPSPDPPLSTYRKMSNQRNPRPTLTRKEIARASRIFSGSAIPLESILRCSTRVSSTFAMNHAGIA